MWQQTGRCLLLGAALVSGMEACTLFPAGSSSTLPSSAFFSIDPDGLKQVQAIAHEQDIRAQNCHTGPTCEEVYYTRGLVALFENRADAITKFQEMHTTMPNSRYDAAAIGWLNLLQDTMPATIHTKALIGQLRQEVLHNLLERTEFAADRGVDARSRRVAELNP